MIFYLDDLTVADMKYPVCIGREMIIVSYHD